MEEGAHCLVGLVVVAFWDGCEVEVKMEMEGRVIVLWGRRVLVGGVRRVGFKKGRGGGET